MSLWWPPSPAFALRAAARQAVIPDPRTPFDFRLKAEATTHCFVFDGFRHKNTVFAFGGFRHETLFLGSVASATRHLLR